MTPHAFARLFPEFRAPSWAGWRRILRRLTPQIRELFILAGRGGGKSRFSALLAAGYATRRYRQAPGEEIVIGVFAPDRRQARITFRYIGALLRSDPSLAALIQAETRERIELRGDVRIEVITASKAAPRGRSYALVIVEEAAMLPNEEASAEPDVELLRAVRPALARVPGSLLCVIGSPYAARGVLHDAWREGDAADRIVIAADTLTLNPTFRRREIERAFQRDPVAAASEYGRDGTIAFRPDVAGLLADDAIAACVAAGVRERPPDPSVDPPVAHFDAATGSGEDAAALAIAWGHDRGRAELACVRQWPPPFSPANVVAEASTILRSYGISATTIDKFAPGLVAEMFREHAIEATVADLDTSAAFIALLALINSKRVDLLDDPALLGELRRLERRPGSGGRDQVGHPARGHDDVAAATAQALVRATRAPVEDDGPIAIRWDDAGPRQGGGEREIVGQRKWGNEWVPVYSSGVSVPLARELFRQLVEVTREDHGW